MQSESVDLARKLPERTLVPACCHGLLELSLDQRSAGKECDDYGKDGITESQKGLNQQRAKAHGRRNG